MYKKKNTRKNMDPRLKEFLNQLERDYKNRMKELEVAFKEQLSNLDVTASIMKLSIPNLDQTMEESVNQEIKRQQETSLRNNSFKNREKTILQKFAMRSKIVNSKRTIRADNTISYKSPIHSKVASFKKRSPFLSPSYKKAVKRICLSKTNVDTKKGNCCKKLPLNYKTAVKPFALETPKRLALFKNLETPKQLAPAFSRRPRSGEVAKSALGTPVLTDVYVKPNEVTNINIPLKNKNIVFLGHGSDLVLGPDEEISENVKRDLKQFQKQLEIIISSSISEN